MSPESRREAVLQALRAGGGTPRSGEAIAEELGVSRAAVAKHVDALRRKGYGIEAVPGIGYRLVGAPDVPYPSEVRPLLESGMWIRLEGGGPTGSTNDDLKALAAEGAPEGTVVLASAQALGRGRMGRTWESPPGGAYLSALLRPDVTPARAASLSPTAALGVARGLGRLGVDARVKWPNDVLAPDGRKLAGVLLEMAAEADGVRWVVVGCGIDVRREGRSVPGAAYVSDLVERPVGTAEVAAAVLDGLADAYRGWRDAGCVVPGGFARRDALRSREVVVRDARGEVVASGLARGVAGDGSLRVETGAGERTVTAGDVTLADPGDEPVDPRDEPVDPRDEPPGAESGGHER